MKRLIWIIPLILFGIVMIFVLYLKFALPNVGPAPDIKVEITPERLERGEYLTNTVMACIDCHSQRDMTKFSGPITGVPFAGGGEEFTEELGAPGDFYAPNLTPYHLADWTDGEIYRALTAGVSKDGRALFPVMPYHLYGQGSREDIYSVIAYLRTLPSIENTVPVSKAKFPFSLIMNTIPKKTEHNEIPQKNDKTKYGEYMITIAGCVDCHTPMEKGKLIMEKAYSGGMEFKLPTGIVRSANITPDETGIGLWDEEIFVSRFTAYHDSLFTPFDVKQGFNTIMPWTVYAKMDTFDLQAIFAYLQSLDPIENQVELFTPAEELAEK
jgi:mono/diheme cytochrome c family protein